MVKIVCPINKTEAIAMGVIGGIVGQPLFIVSRPILVLISVAPLRRHSLGCSLHKDRSEAS